jgi:hypothetical protein
LATSKNRPPLSLAVEFDTILLFVFNFPSWNVETSYFSVLNSELKVSSKLFIFSALPTQKETF